MPDDVTITDPYNWGEHATPDWTGQLADWLREHPGVHFVYWNGKPSWRHPLRRLRWIFQPWIKPPRWEEMMGGDDS